MSDPFRDASSASQSLSALVDGEATAPEVARACAQWRDDPEARERWHSYHLIGDVMRSEDLAQADRGADFLRAFRERLAQEPVVLAPAAAQATLAAQPAVAVQAPALRKRVWAGPLSVAAGIVLVVGALVNGQWLPGGGAADPSLASAGAPVQMAAGASPSVDLTSSLVSLTPAEMQSATGIHGDGSAPSFSRPEPVSAAVTMVRDPQVDGLLRARRAPGSSESFSGQGGLLQQVGYGTP
ncbi:sigma-E factor negative regulatory protein [Aquabacterium sp.]|uniref:sigma-E factor negative regulatory protein n=1 Tax=Aquabacterium sp. TaxID=1872578 RepID=UPI0025C2ACF0|nr:sigma-E factor negative regulatory protein [Aquabacterium sp.]